MTQWFARLIKALTAINYVSDLTLLSAQFFSFLPQQLASCASGMSLQSFFAESDLLWGVCQFP